MTPDTWGISGPTFLMLYLGAVVAAAILAAIHRHTLFAGDTGTDVDRLSPQQVAYLNGRERQAIYTALGGLRAAGAIDSGPDRTLAQTGPLPSGVTPLDTAVYSAAGRRIRVRDLGSDPWVTAAVDQLRERLENAGLARTAAQRRTARLWAIAGTTLVGIGIARLVAGIGNGKPVGFLVPSVVLAVFVTIAMLVTPSGTATRAATRGMAELRRRHQYLSPGQSPSYATYGAAAAAMGVALYGAASLYDMDPVFAAGADTVRAKAANGWAGADGGGTSCGGGGGTSCGGGGGCGGGGCGG